MTTTDAKAVGSSRRLTFTFKDVAAALADPTSIALKIREPDGTVISKTQADMTSTTTGVWTYDHPVTKVGRHYAHVDGDGAVEAAEQIEFYALTKVA